jgi:hypothetical protein
MERETRFELATSTLARLHSTTELFPLSAVPKHEEYNRGRKYLSTKNYLFFFTIKCKDKSDKPEKYLATQSVNLL